MKTISKRVLRKKQNYASGFDISSKEFEILKQQEFECCRCSANLIKSYDFPAFEEKEAYCEECYIEYFYTVCEVCENNFPNIDYPNEEEHIYINKGLSKITGYETGIYKVLSKPCFYGSIVTGFDSFFDNSLQLIKSIDLDIYYNFLYQGKYEIKSGCICPDCVEKFTNKGYIKPQYNYNLMTDSFKINPHKSINIRALIKGAKI